MAQRLCHPTRHHPTAAGRPQGWAWRGCLPRGASPGMPNLVSVLNKVDLPTLGSPTMPTCSSSAQGSSTQQGPCPASQRTTPDPAGCADLQVGLEAPQQRLLLDLLLLLWRHLHTQQQSSTQSIHLLPALPIVNVLVVRRGRSTPRPAQDPYASPFGCCKFLQLLRCSPTRLAPQSPPSHRGDGRGGVCTEPNAPYLECFLVTHEITSAPPMELGCWRLPKRTGWVAVPVRCRS